MTTPEDERRAVPAYVALVRIGAVIGMSAFGAFGIFMLVGGWWLYGLISLALAVPFFFGMRLAEGPPQAGHDPGD
jgi:hypothetical protein